MPQGKNNTTSRPMSLWSTMIRKYGHLLLTKFTPTRSLLTHLGYVCGFLAIAFGYYFYLNALYLVDEVLEADVLRELTLIEKTTIYVQAPNNLDHLKRFVLHYSICPTIHEIKIRGRNDHKWKDQIQDEETLFKFTKTHSSVTFEPALPPSVDTFPIFELPNVATESVLFLDADVFISCDDVAFTQSVWRSASDALVGYFPRLHGRHLPTDSERSWRLLGWSQMASQGAYSLMLSSGVMLHKKFVIKGVTNTNMGSAPSSSSSNSMAGSSGSRAGNSGNGVGTSTNRIGTVTIVEEDKHKYMVALSLALSRPPCLQESSLVIPLLAAALGAAPPVWVDVSYDIKSITTTPHSNINNPIQRDECFTHLMHVLKLQSLDYSWHKSTRASTYWIW